MTGYGKRNTNLERAHGVVEADWSNLLKIINPKDGDKILDLMGGSGVVADKLYKYGIKEGVDI